MTQTQTQIQALNNRIILKQIKLKRKSDIIVPDSMQDREPIYEVISVGCGKHTMTGELIPPSVAVGDHVILDTYGCRQIKIDSETTVIACKSEDIIGIIKT